MEYYTYWSILDAPSNSIKPYTVCLIIAFTCGILWLLIKKYKKENETLDKTILLWFAGIFSIFSFCGYTYLRFVSNDHNEELLLKLLESTKVRKIEGKISDFKSFRQMSRHGNVTEESFYVDSVKFSYDDALLGRFNKYYPMKNGILKNGLEVKITYGKNIYEILQNEHGILKIEIAKHNSQNYSP